MIKRPLPIIGCAYLLSLAVVFCFNLSLDGAMIIGAIACGSVCAVCLIKRFSLNVLRVVLLSALAFTVGLMVASYKTVEVPRQASAVYGQKARITAVMLDRKGQRGSKYDYEIVTTAVALYNEQTEQYTSSGVTAADEDASYGNSAAGCRLLRPSYHKREHYPTLSSCLRKPLCGVACRRYLCLCVQLR